MLKELNIFSLPRFLVWLIAGCLMSGCAGSSLPLVGDRAADTQVADEQAVDEQTADVQVPNEQASDEQAADEGTADEQAAVPTTDEAEYERPGRQFRDCAQCPEMVVVPAGEFIMGSPAGEEGRYDLEGPQHRVLIGQPFAVGKYEVTRGEFSRFIAATGYSSGGSCYTYEGGSVKDRPGRGWRNPGFSQTDRDPVVCVNWNDAQAYVLWLSDKTGKSYRLLSESEWEYAARARTKTRYHFGDEASQLCVWGNVSDQSFKRKYGGPKVADCDDGHVHTAPVGSYKANGFGLHDMHGNVLEWVEDCWNDSYAGVPNDGSAWRSGDCEHRVLRGGSWSYIPRGLRSALRGRAGAVNRGNIGGLRIARTL